MQKKAILIGAMDTKGNEFLYVKQILEEQGIRTFTVNTGILGKPVFTPDVSSQEVAQRGGSSLNELRERKERALSIAVMSEGAKEIVNDLVEKNEAGALYSMGRVAGTTIGAIVMQSVPIGIPKLIVSTVASGDVHSYIGSKDIMMMYSVVDVIGLNTISKRIYRNAAYALTGMMNGQAGESVQAGTKKTIGMTSFGSTTACVTHTREILEQQGFDVLVFHATGTGGLAMEQLIREGYIDGVADVTTTEIADELLGGVFSAGPTRLEAAGEMGIPQIVSVGALDSVNFGAPITVPRQYQFRKLYSHNPTTTLMRTNKVENFELGRMIAKKLNKSKNAVIVVFPKGGVSSLDMGKQPFEGRVERQALLDGLKQYLKEEIPILEVEKDINDPETAEIIASNLTRLFHHQKSKSEDSKS